MQGLLAGACHGRIDSQKARNALIYGANMAAVAPYRWQVRAAGLVNRSSAYIILLEESNSYDSPDDLIESLNIYLSAVSEPDKTLARIAQIANQVDEDEAPPTPAVITQTSNLIRQAGSSLRTSMPEAVVSTFYGEINVTWRNGNDIVRLACFPNRPSILQFGNLSQPLGSYQSQPDPSAEDLAERLDALTRDDVR
jgi:hypothetical protein